MSAHATLIARYVFLDLVGSIFWFPVWWYTKGLARVASLLIRWLRERSRQYGLKIWIKNFFVPMYGQYDIYGRLISVFMRTVILIGRSIALLVEALIYVIGLAIWLALPAVALIFLFLGAWRRPS
ncbi:hypothetical protein HY479_02175 [Candidatus Uhrbacteria bacterium]|nr:hypothetical protein [Candidatus Uhrbacteria bacterium]